jgi:hypothetical protein
LGYDLENIESQIKSLIAAAGSRKLVKESDKALEIFEQECMAARLAFKRQFLSAIDEQTLSRYFHFHQQSLLLLINNLSDSLTRKPSALLSRPLDGLIYLLKTLEEEFREYFDASQEIPKCLIDKIASQAERSAEFISWKFQNTCIESELLQIILSAFNKDKMLNNGCTYGRAYFLRNLESEMRSFSISTNDSDLLRMDVCNLLVKANFNCESFFRYYTSRINKSLVACETLTDRIDQMAYFYKVCNQDFVVFKFSFHPSQPPINMQLVEWISQEMEYLRSKQQLLFSQPSRTEGVPNDFKLNFDLSVSHLAYLFKSFIETGVVQNKNTSELIRFLTKFVKTKRAESVSYESFRIKFYNPETGTKDAVKKTLQSLLNYMSKN